MTYELRDISIKFQLRIKWSPLKKAEVIGSRIRMGMRAFRPARRRLVRNMGRKRA
jgi:hypothetical protein